MGLKGAPNRSYATNRKSFPSRERNYAVRRRYKNKAGSPEPGGSRRHTLDFVDSNSNAGSAEVETEQQQERSVDTPELDDFQQYHKKTCNSCKCPRESHEVYHEEWVNVRERLGFKPPVDPDKRVSRDRSHSEGYSWVPPGLPSHKIEQYFRSLPSSKVPRLGSVGEKYRDKQLVTQLPKQDLALAYCKHVEPTHHSSYEDFIHARNEIALDIAYVKEATFPVNPNVLYLKAENQYQPPLFYGPEKERNVGKTIIL